MENVGPVLMIVWIAGALAVAAVANGRGRNMFLWGVLAILVSPLLAFACLVALPMRGYPLLGFDGDLHVECAACKGPFRHDALRCMTCGDAPAPRVAETVRSASEPGWTRKTIA
jgi:hypothetical protein